MEGSARHTHNRLYQPPALRGFPQAERHYAEVQEADAGGTDAGEAHAAKVKQPAADDGAGGEAEAQGHRNLRARAGSGTDEGASAATTRCEGLGVCVVSW